MNISGVGDTRFAEVVGFFFDREDDVVVVVGVGVGVVVGVVVVFVFAVVVVEGACVIVKEVSWLSVPADVFFVVAVVFLAGERLEGSLWVSVIISIQSFKYIN
jgi:hypothetical protein